MSEVALARKALFKLYRRMREEGADDYADEMLVSLKKLKREPAIRRGPVRHPPVTAELRDAVKEYAAEYQLAHFSTIARIFKTNSGRVSEIMNGKYDHL